MQCDSLPGESCASHGAGHGLLVLQARVTAATPSKWQDGLVRGAGADGWIAIDLLDGDTAWVWNHTDRSQSLSVGSPVAVHALYHTLAIGHERVNILIAAPVD
jgi:hypothetical protein